MNFRILCFIKILQPPLGWQNLDRTIAYTRFHRIKGGSGVPPLSPTNNFDRVDETLLSVTLAAGFIKFHQLFQRSLVIGGGGDGGHSASAFYSVKMCVMINLTSVTMCFASVLL